MYLVMARVVPYQLLSRVEVPHVEFGGHNLRPYAAPQTPPKGQGIYRGPKMDVQVLVHINSASYLFLG
jgi:hypothetical protein